ncbi:conserved hypothetical protein [Paecilomyces variotii No. 5]|uniref:DNA polymerase epsilon subunit D n=1 Tax=Byssochlamys spectabilis (strain No. 5 / NBRC 109023) TaxID=1356009 RepID=V5I671_BYSSN|nr:conserved hypothetical protein [Paecilomyces variotii No. 5]
MPPRKSTSSVTPAEADETTGTPTATQQQLKAQAEGGVNVEDYVLPRSVTLRLAKSVLPPNTTIQKDAVLAIQKAATVFVNYVASHANEHTLKRTLAPADVLSALSELEFDSFRPHLERELAMHTDLANSKRQAKKASSEQTASQQTQEQTEGSAAPAGTADEASKESKEKDTVPARGTKRVKRDGDTESKPAVEDDDGTEEEEEEEEEEHEEDGDETQEEEQEEDEDEEDEEEETQNDNERVEDLDGNSSRRRMANPDAVDSDAGSESDYDDGPGAQLRENMGLG